MTNNMSEKTEFKFDVNAQNGSDVIIREGQAIPVREPIKIDINGLIDSPFRYLQKRLNLLNTLESHVIINRDKLKIGLVVNENNFFRANISGNLFINPDFQKLGINSNESYGTHELADLIKMNRAFFADKNKAMIIESELRNFQAQVDKDIESMNDQRGNIKVKQYQAVKSNIPDSFSLKIPIFKGEKSIVIEVEIAIDAQNFTCTLVSPEAHEHKINVRDNVIDKQISNISKLSQELLIIEQ